MAASISLNDEPAPIERLIHDLAIPLSIMKLNLELLQQNNDPNYIRRLNIGWEKMDLILKQRSSIRVLRSGKYLSDLIDEVLDLFGSSINKAGITVVKDYEADPKLNWHHDKFTRIIINLIQNAIEALGEYRGVKKIKIKTSFKAKLFRISVFSSGKGFPEEILNDLGKCRILRKGRGRGLFNCALLIRKYFKGRIMFINPKHGGAQVLILIPQYILENE